MVKRKSADITLERISARSPDVFTVSSYINSGYVHDVGEKSRVPTDNGSADVHIGDIATGKSCTCFANGDHTDIDNVSTSTIESASTSTTASTSGSSSEAKASADGTQMKKSINFLHCTAIMVAVTGHSSVFISPNAILSTVGSVGAALVVWLIGGVINWMLALCFAELATMLPKAGGPYAYVMRTFGPLAGFLIMYGYVVLLACQFWAFLAYTAALYILEPITDVCGCTIPPIAVNILAAWIMVSLVALNCVYMKYITKVQTLLSATKLLALTLIVAGGVWQFARGEAERENFEDVFAGTTREPGEWALAIFYAIFSYGGWQVMTSLMEEVKEPGRDLPRSVYTTFVLVIGLYLLTNVSYFTVLTPQEVTQSNSVALLFMQKLYKPLSYVISVFVATTSIGALNASIMGHSRLLFAGARVGHMPVLHGMIHHKYLTPWPAIFTLLLLSLAMLFSGGLKTMMQFISLFSTIMSIACVSSLLYLRWTKPNEHRPYKTWLAVPIIQLIVNVAILVLAIYQKPHEMGVGLAVLFAGIPIYWFGVLWENKPSQLTYFVERCTVTAQKLFLIQKTL